MAATATDTAMDKLWHPATRVRVLHSQVTLVVGGESAILPKAFGHTFYGDSLNSYDSILIISACISCSQCQP
ncbi:MAG TPA: hypothetical protein V6D15_03295 [Oculatellaceae cyanobacterium]